MPRVIQLMRPLFLGGLLLLMPDNSLTAEYAQARSMVISKQGIAATEHPLASQAAAQIMAGGGNAFDAAVAANAVMGVVSPMMCGIGGDLFAIVYDAESGQLHGLNASGWSPEALTLESMTSKGHRTMPIRDMTAVTVPGAVEGWSRLLARFGNLEFEEVLKPAIHYAEQGFPVTEWVAKYWAGETGFLETRPSAKSVFLPAGKAPGVGEHFRNPDLAWSLRQIAREGASAFYDGVLTDRMLALSRAHGGLFERSDFSEYAAEWVEPIHTDYRGWRVYEIPPNGQGIAALSMLNLMERFSLDEHAHNSAAALHVLIESKKLAYMDMLQHVADPRFASVPVDRLLSKDYAAERFGTIQMDQANCLPKPGWGLRDSPDTTYLSVVDRDGNMISLIQSVYYQFGSGFVPEGCGFPLQNRGALFSLNPEHPNRLEGRKRSLHTIIPGFMEKDETRIAFGIMGGWNQSQAHAQFVSNIVDHRMNVQLALEAPRFTKGTFSGCDVQVESRMDPDVLEALEERGHRVSVLDAFSSSMGGGQAVMRDFRAGTNYGGSDPRKDGAAVPEPWKP